MEAYGRRRRQPDNRRALLVPITLWGVLVAPLLVVFAVTLISGQVGLLVLAFLLALPAGAGTVRLVPYLRDMAAGPVAVEGGVIEKRVERRYLVFRGRSVLLDSDYANVAAMTAGQAAHSSGAGPLPVMEQVNTFRGGSIVSIGGAPTLAAKSESVREAREEMDVNRFFLPAVAFAKVAEEDQVRVWYYPNSRTTAGVERWDDRLQRFVAV